MAHLSDSHSEPKKELEEVLMPMIEKYEVVLVEDSEGLLHW